MRNLRKFAAVVLAVALVLTSMTAAFAASTTNEFEAQATVLKDLGIWAGDADGNLMLDQDLSRVQGAVLVLKTVLGKTDADQAAADTAVLSTYADADKVPAWATGWMALAVKEGVLKGTTANELLANGPLYGKDLASMYMNALGFSATNEYAKAVELLAAKSAGTFVDAALVSDLTNAKLTRDAATAIVFDALTATAKDATKTVIETYVGSDASLAAIALAAGLTSAAVLDVASVSATNLRELVVTFNKAPDATEAKKTANYKIGSNNPEAVTLSADGKTVTLRTSNTNKMGNYGTVDLTVLKAVGFDADKVIKGIAIKDVTVPSAVSVSATGPKNIKVTLSEPLDESVSSANIAASLKIDSGLIAIDNAGVTISGLELSIRTYSDLSEGAHKIEFLTATNIKDNAGYPLQAATLTFDYVKDITPLSFVVDSSNETSVTIKFNKAVKAGTFAGNAGVKLTHTYNTITNQVIADTAVTTTDDQTFVISFGTKPFPPSTTTVYIDGADKIVDNYGNKLATTSFTVTTTADMTKPTATAEFVDATTVKVTYSEDVVNGVSDANGANNPANYTLKTGTDVISVNSVAFDGTSKKVVKLTTNTMNGGTYTLTIKNVKDVSVAKNQIDEVTLTFTGTDKVAPTVKAADSKFIATNKFKVVFSEAMDVASITDKAVYKINTSALTADDTVEAVDGNKAAIITFKVAPTTGFTLHVARVKDAAGNWTEEFDNIINVTSATVTPVGMKEAQIISKTGIKVVISDTIKDMVVGDFLYSTTAGVFVAPKAISVAIVDGVTSITLVTEDLGNTTTYAGLQVKTNTTVAAKNTFDNPVSIAATNVTVDKCAPEKADIALTAGSATNGTQLKTVAITYAEAIYAPSVQDADYTVAGYEVESVTVSGSIVTLTLKTVTYGSYVAGITEVAVTQVGEIQDSNRNTSAAQSAWTKK